MKTHQQTVPAGQWPTMTALPEVLPTSTLKPQMPISPARIGTGERTLDSHAAALVGQMSAAVAIVDTAMTVRLANASARTLLAENPVVTLVGDKLVANDPDHRRELTTLLGSANWRADTPAQDSMGMRMVNEKRGIAVILVIRRFNTGAMMSGPDNRMFSISLHQPNKVKKIDTKLLREIFDLSRAEASIAGYLAQGYEPCQIAALREVSVETIRAQLRNVFAKTCTNRQADVVRVVTDLSVIVPQY